MRFVQTPDMSALSPAAPRRHDWRRPLRYLWRVPFLLLHVFVALPVALLCITPIGALLRVRGHRLDHLAIRGWQGGLLRVFGLRTRRFGEPLPGAVMFVANHVSWIDITLMHSQRVMGFVAKAEISRWPVVGWLASRGGTIYHHRGDNESLHGVMHQMVQRLEAGQAVGVFPEGRTTDGAQIGVFHARIFQPAVVAAVPAQPVALKYGERGSAQTTVAFQRGEHFLGNFLRLLGEPPRVAEVHFLEPVTAGEDGRRRMADACRARIIAAMGS
jgi:1-acyl-sn-glycerol-3-phosphate acyltransferase